MTPLVYCWGRLVYIQYFVPHNAHKQIIQAPHRHSFKQEGIHDTTDYNNAARLLRVGRDDSTTEPYNTVFGGSLFPGSRGDAGGVGGTDSQILLRGLDEEHSGIPSRIGGSAAVLGWRSLRLAWSTR